MNLPQGGPTKAYGLKNGVTARIAKKGTGYGNKALCKASKAPISPKKAMVPPSIKGLRTQTMNRVTNYRFGNNPITQDTQMSNLF